MVILNNGQVPGNPTSPRPAFRTVLARSGGGGQGPAESTARVRCFACGRAVLDSAGLARCATSPVVQGGEG